MSKIARMSPRGFRKLVHSLNVPYTIDEFGCHSFLFDLHNIEFYTFFRSFRRAIAYKQLKPFYSYSEIAVKMGKNVGTIRSLVKKMDVPIYKTGRKSIIFVTDILLLGKIEQF